jgi:hypothetical protein
MDNGRGLGFWIGLLSLAVVAAVVGMMLWRRRQPAAQRTSERALLDPLFTTKLYGRLLQWAQWLRLPLLSSQTPNEQAATLMAAVPEGQAAIQSITELYVEDLYSPHRPDQRKSEQALLAWSGLQPLLRRTWLRLRLRPVTGARQLFKRLHKPAERE